jgi:excisionase family DNA binding protein
MTQPLLVISPADLAALESRLARIESALEKVNMTPVKEWLTMAEMADLLGVSLATVRRRMNDGQFETREIGGKVMFKRP